MIKTLGGFGGHREIFKTYLACQPCPEASPEIELEGEYEPKGEA